jgi:hypothetical protein
MDHENAKTGKSVTRSAGRLAQVEDPKRTRLRFLISTEPHGKMRVIHN